MFDNLMIDMETTDTIATSGILSIGVVPFNLRNHTMDADHGFYEVASLESQLPQRTISASTMKWWRDQGDTPASRAVWQAPQKRSLSDVLGMLASYCTLYPNADVWSNGASFDIPMLEQACSSYGVKVPWKYSAATCLRTWRKLPGAFDVPYPEFEGIPHHALHDAIHQVKHLFALHSALFPNDVQEN
jgi:hypothetical protein